MTTNVFILCTHNFAYSVLSESMLNHWTQKLGKDVRVYSAGSVPSGHLDPFILGVLTNVGIGTAGYRSKSQDEFVADDVPQMRVIIAIYDSVAAEQRPYWSDSSVKVHWGYADPSNAPGDDEGRRQVSGMARQAIGYRILQPPTLPLDTLSSAELQAQLGYISQD